MYLRKKSENYNTTYGITTEEFKALLKPEVGDIVYDGYVWDNGRGCLKEALGMDQEILEFNGKEWIKR